MSPDTPEEAEFDEIEREIEAEQRNFKYVEAELPIEVVLRSLQNRMHRLVRLTELKAGKSILLSAKRLVERSLHQYEDWLLHGHCVDVQLVQRTTEELDAYDAERGMARPQGNA
jgi:hypothetical protein